jgi:hypothetical protein
MTTSGSVDFSVSRDNILTDALFLAGAVGPEDTVSTALVTHAARQLNKIVKALGAKRVGLWARKTGYILPVSDTNQVILGPSGGHATLSYTQTTLSESAAVGATSIELTATTGFADTRYVGIELDDDTIQWTTQSGAVSGSDITLAAALTEEASEGNYVYVYTTKLQRPLRVTEAYRNGLDDDSDTEMDVVGKAVYESQNSKETEGEPNLLSYDPQLDNGIAYFWPRFEDPRSVLRIVFQRPFEDFDAAGDTPDFPQEWYDPLTLLLAVRLAPVYGMPTADRQLLRQEAGEALALALENEPEEGSYRIQIDMGHG